MRYLTLGIHYPKKGETERIIKEANKISEKARTINGCVDVSVWEDEKNERVIMMSLWENSTIAIEASKILRPLIAEINFSEWERLPSDNMIELKRRG
jgi:quinol monooxygenase YgiN